MKSKFLNRREVLILGLPFLLIGIGAVLLTAREKQRIARESGPLRTVITSVKIEAVTPFEAWQGFTHRVTVEAELEGNKEVPEGLDANKTMPSLDSDVFLSGNVSGRATKIGVGKRIAEKWNVYEVNDSPLAMVYEWETEKIRGFRTFLVNANRFDKGTVQLSGKVRIFQQAINSKKKALINFPGEWKSADPRVDNYYLKRPASMATLDVAIPNEDISQVDRTAPEVKGFVKSSISPSNEKTGMHEGEGETLIKVTLKPFEKSRESISIGPTEILDKNNQPVEFSNPKRRFKPNIRLGSRTHLKDGSMQLERRIPVWDIPAAYGALSYRTWLSFGDSWPVEVRVPLRTDDDLKPPKLLKLDSVQVIGGNVRVRVSYLGELQLESNDEGNFLGSRYFYDNSDSTEFPPVDKSFADRLITHWSQHLTASNGKEYWFNNAVRVQSVTTVAINVYEIVYATNALAALKKGETMKFSAHVGIEGDGFIPIQAKITKSK